VVHPHAGVPALLFGCAVVPSDANAPPPPSTAAIAATTTATRARRWPP